jgi:putative FmdB family regulatory protein
MPIYEYRCADCGTQFEKLVRRATASADVVCPSCGQKSLSQQFSTFATHSNGGTKASDVPACPGGVCRTPELCGMD